MPGRYDDGLPELDGPAFVAADEANRVSLFDGPPIDMPRPAVPRGVMVRCDEAPQEYFTPGQVALLMDVPLGAVIGQLDRDACVLERLHFRWSRVHKKPTVGANTPEFRVTNEHRQ